MSKWYEVAVSKITVYAVEVADDEGEDQAMELALDEEWGGDKTATCNLAEGARIDSIKRHADEVLPMYPKEPA